jgi:hypothetical protein
VFDLLPHSLHHLIIAISNDAIREPTGAAVGCQKVDVPATTSYRNVMTCTNDARAFKLSTLNALRHSKARKVEIRVSSGADGGESSLQETLSCFQSTQSLLSGAVSKMVKLVVICGNSEVNVTINKTREDSGVGREDDKLQGFRSLGKLEDLHDLSIRGVYHDHKAGIRVRKI